MNNTFQNFFDIIIVLFLLFFFNDNRTFSQVSIFHKFMLNPTIHFIQYDESIRVDEKETFKILQEF